MGLPRAKKVDAILTMQPGTIRGVTNSYRTPVNAIPGAVTRKRAML